MRQAPMLAGRGGAHLFVVLTENPAIRYVSVAVRDPADHLRHETMTPTPQPANEMPPRRRRWGWLIGVLLIAGGGAYAYLERPWQTKPAVVAVEVATAGPVSQVLAVNGRVVARDAVKVRSAVSGQAVDVRVREGETVAVGDVLVQLDTAQPKAVLDQAKAALEAGRIKQQQAQANSDRARALGQNATRSTQEDAELSLTAASSEVARLQAAVDQAASLLGQYTITAPLSGVVLDSAVDRGQLVDAQTELFTVADLSQLLVETDVDELYSSRIREGLKVLLKPVGDSVPRDGTIVFAAPTVDPSTGGRAIKIAFDAPVDLPVGLTVNANIIVAEVADALSIPRGAILTEGTKSHVLVLDGELVAARHISFSDWPAARVIVTSGLVAGDRVILDPATVAPGQAAVAE